MDSAGGQAEKLSQESQIPPKAANKVSGRPSISDDHPSVFRRKDESSSPPPKDLPHLRVGSSSSSSTHRQSISDQLRHPPSPRAQRQPSLTQAAIYELMSNPPPAQAGDPAFVGRDWKTIRVGELVDEKDIQWVQLDTSVKDATESLDRSSVSVILIRKTKADHTVIGTFDYNDLNAYLLLVVGLASPETEEEKSRYHQLAQKANEGREVSLKEAKDVARKDAFVTLPRTAYLTNAVEIFGGGVHRLIIVDEKTNKVKGILSQLRLVKFLWENGRSFPAINDLYPQTIWGLGIGSHRVISINGDCELQGALKLMDGEGVTSLAVTDSASNVIGNISTADVRLLTDSSSVSLLGSTCIHFISVILSQRGMEAGKDSVPVFYVNPNMSLAQTVAKLVATKSHRMWIVENASPAPSVPVTPVSQPAVFLPPASYTAVTPTGPTHPSIAASSGTVAHHPSISASSLPGSSISGRLTGVVSLTDILNLFARKSDLSPLDPNESRRQRRRSSSSSMRGRISVESGRSSSLDVRR